MLLLPRMNRMKPRDEITNSRVEKITLRLLDYCQGSTSIRAKTWVIGLMTGNKNQCLSLHIFNYGLNRSPPSQEDCSGRYIITCKNT